LGLEFDAQSNSLMLAPHLPADWKQFSVAHVRAGSGTVDLAFSRSSEEIALTAERRGEGEVRLDFQPALSPRAEVLAATFRGKPVAFRSEQHSTDQHLIVPVALAAGQNRLKIRLRNDFAVTAANGLPALGGSSQGLRIVSETWSPAHDTLTLETEGFPGRTYRLAVWGGDQVKSVDGARLAGDMLEEIFTSAEDALSPRKQSITLHFSPLAKSAKAAGIGKGHTTVLLSINRD
jgi:hypothetical protein